MLLYDKKWVFYGQQQQHSPVTSLTVDFSGSTDENLSDPIVLASNW